MITRTIVPTPRMINYLLFCLPFFMKGLYLQDEKQQIVAKHNELRSVVAQGLESRGVAGKGQPSAANMKKMSWDDDLSDVAQT